MCNWWIAALYTMYTGTLDYWECVDMLRFLFGMAVVGFQSKTSEKLSILQNLRYVRLIVLNTLLKKFTKRPTKHVFKTSEGIKRSWNCMLWIFAPWLRWLELCWLWKLMNRTYQPQNQIVNCFNTSNILCVYHIQDKTRWTVVNPQ